MKKYTYENATVYITRPVEAQLKNIQTATETFLRKVIKERRDVVRRDV